MSESMSISNKSLNFNTKSIASMNTERKTMEAKAINTVNDMRTAELQGTVIPVAEEQVIRAIDRAVKALSGPNTSIDVSVHERTNTITVKVLNKETGEVIREIPPEKTLDLVAKMMEIAGLLIDERV